MISFMLILLTIATIFIFYRQKVKFKKWKNLNVPGPEPMFILGNVKKFIFMKSSIVEVYAEIYNKFKDCRYVGIYLLNRPAILIRDPEMVEEVLVKNFSHFHDNDVAISSDDDPIFGRNPFAVKGESWKMTRGQHLSSLTLTKVKAMFHDVQEVGNKMVSFLMDRINENNGVYCMDALELMARYTTDVITLCALNVDSKSFGRNEPTLRNAGKGIFEPNFANSIKNLAVFLMPPMSKLLKMRMVPINAVEMYRDMVKNVLNYRESNNIKKGDFFDHIREYRGVKMSIDEMAALVGALYINGFGTNSSALNFMLYELAENVQVQNKLRKEIMEYVEKEEISFEGIQELKYLEAVVQESLRKYPPFPQFTKVCTREYKFPKANESSSEFTIELGTPVIVPAYAIHNDGKYFPEPKEFKPERFLENKEDIVKYAYIPFGEGPRTCIGVRFALLQSKMALINLLINFEMRVNYKKTKVPITLDPFGLVLAAKGRIWINFTKISK